MLIAKQRCSDISPRSIDYSSKLLWKKV